MKPLRWLPRSLSALALLILSLPLLPPTAAPVTAQAPNRVGVAEPGATSVDEIAPATITTRTASTGSAPGSVELSWIAPGDDGTTGTASTYLVRHNTEPITEINWTSSTAVTGEPAPLSAGHVQTMTVSGLQPSQTYYFAIKAQDEVPNASSASNIARATALRSSMAVFLPLVTSSYGSVATVIPETTKVLPPETTQYLSSISGDGSVFTFTHSTPQLAALAPGDIIVGDVAASAPYGFLRRVSSVSLNGDGLIVTTVGTTLEEAIDTGSLHVSGVLEPSQMRRATALLKGVTLVTASELEDEFYIRLDDVVLLDGDGDPATTGDQLTASGSIRLGIGFDFDLEVKGFELQELSFAVEGVESVDLQIKCDIELASAGASVEIPLPIDLPATTVWIGYLPVVVVPDLTLRIGAQGSVHVGIRTGVTQKATVRAGLEYANGEWSPIGQFSNEFHFTPPELYASMGLKGYAEPQLDLLIYGVVGPRISLEAYLKLEADVAQVPWWTLWGGLEVPVAVQVEVLGRTIAQHDTAAIGYRIELARAQDNNPPDLPSDPTPSDDAINQSRSVDLWWTGDDIDGDSVTYDVYLEAGDTTPDVLVSTQQGGTFYDPGMLSSRARYYWRIIAKDEHGATNAGPVWSFSTWDGEHVMIFVPAGEFQMGCDESNPLESCYTDEVPPHTIDLDAYYIDKYEVTNAQYAQCVAAGACDPAGERSRTRISYRDDPAFRDYPVIGVSWYDAASYCAWAGMRLPTEAEWEKAARGSTDARMYPWGDEAVDCSHANYAYLVHGSLISYCVGDTTQVGDYPTGASPYGALDMSGNVMEWVNDCFDPEYYSVSPPSNPPGPTCPSYWQKTVRGGNYASSWDRVRVAERSYTLPENTGWYLGFRCAR